MEKNFKYPPLLSDEIWRRIPLIKTKEFLIQVPRDLIMRIVMGEPLTQILEKEPQFLHALVEFLGEPAEYWLSIDAEYQRWRKENYGSKE